MNAVSRPEPAAAVRPDLRFLLAHPAHLLALGFGSGLPRYAPGTWGTLFAWVSFVALDRWLAPAAWWVLLALALPAGVWAAARTGRALGVADHKSIVIDEVVAFWLVLAMLPKAWLAQTIAFAVFRAFDILKPPPIGWLDRRLKNGFGVMLDDLLAAVYTVMLLLALSVVLQ